MSKKSTKDQPATQHDLELWAGQLLYSIEQMFTDSHKRIMVSFQAVAEHLLSEVAGANQDEIVTLKEKYQDHEERIAVLEDKNQK